MTETLTRSEVAKNLLFGASMVIALPISRVLPAWLAWALVGTVATFLFGWLPPRRHAARGLWSDIGWSLLSGATAALAVTAVNMLPA